MMDAAIYKAPVFGWQTDQQSCKGLWSKSFENRLVVGTHPLQCDIAPGGGIGLRFYTVKEGGHAQNRSLPPERLSLTFWRWPHFLRSFA